MAYFMVAGKPDCAHFVHCLYIAEYLNKHLPHFKYRTVQLDGEEWKTWLVNINKKNGWFHITSPLIWKELNRCGGKPCLIGGISDFWEYVYDYYGLQSLLPKETLTKLLKNNLDLFEATAESDKNQASQVRRILIYGAMAPMVPILLPALNDIPNLSLALGINIILYQPNLTPDQEEYLEDLIEDFKTINYNVELTDCLDTMTYTVDLIIYTDNYIKSKKMDFDHFLTQNVIRMKEVGLHISRCAKRGVRIILTNDGPLCFCANVLLNTSSFVRPHNIVAVTADVGLKHLRAAAEHLNIPLTDLGAPPVWGSVGLTSDCKFVDVGSVIQRGYIYRPYSRALRVGASSSLALGTIQSELRFLSYLSDSLDMEEVVCNREGIVESRLERKEILPKVVATVEVIKMWYAQKDTGDIISLGVSSDGSFDLPNGLFFSQPVMLQDNIWKPVANFPVPSKTKERIRILAPEALKKVEEYWRN